MLEGATGCFWAHAELLREVSLITDLWYNYGRSRPSQGGSSWGLPMRSGPNFPNVLRLLCKFSIKETYKDPWFYYNSKFHFWFKTRSISDNQENKMTIILVGLPCYRTNWALELNLHFPRLCIYHRTQIEIHHVEAVSKPGSPALWTPLLAGSKGGQAYQVSPPSG